jgi:hypothetical protein
MNRTQRRATDARTGHARLAASLTDIHRIGQGVWELRIYAPEAFLEAMLNSALLDDETFHDCRVVARAIEQIVHRTGTLCLLCQQVFSGEHLPGLFVILRPSLDAIRATTDGGSHVLTNGVCLDCAAQPALPRRVVDFYRRNIISDLREIRIAEAGAA